MIGRLVPEGGIRKGRFGPFLVCDLDQGMILISHLITGRTACQRQKEGWIRARKPSRAQRILVGDDDRVNRLVVRRM